VSASYYLVRSVRGIPTNRQTIRPNSIPKFTVTQNVFFLESGTVSLSIQLAQVTRAPEEKPNKILPMQIGITLSHTTWSADEAIPSKLSQIALSLRPLPTNLPANKLPMVRPKIPHEDMIVLYRSAWLSFQYNFAAIIGLT
jgi:hypothetical protein